MAIRFYLTRPQSDASTSIYALIRFKGAVLKYYTNEQIKPIQWSTTKGEAKPTAESINANLRKFVALVDKTINSYKHDNELQHPTVDKLRALLDAAYKGQKDANTFESYYLDFVNDIKEGKRTNKDGTKFGFRRVQEYKNTFEHIKDFKAKVKGRYKNEITFELLDSKFTRDFKHYLETEHNHKPNTIAKVVKIIKAVLLAAIADSVTKPTALLAEVLPSAPSDDISLNAEQLQALSSAVVEDTHKVVRDLFVVGCYTGLRLSDLKVLTTASVQGDFLEVVTQKTNSRIVIPLHDEVKRIVGEYGGKLPTPPSDQHLNLTIKQICSAIPQFSAMYNRRVVVEGKNTTEAIPLHAMVKSHTMRRTFATLMYKAGIPTKSIMAVTGHKTEASFTKYLKLTTDDHAQIMAMHWERMKGNVSNLKAVV
jgi:integrase